MRVSLNVILDAIGSHRHDLGEGIPGDISFHAISLLPRGLGDVSPDNLYICRLSEALKSAEGGTQLYYICIRDRIKDELETPEALRSMVIISENLELEDLFCEVQDTFTLVSNWCESMQQALIMQKSIQDILSMSEAVIGNFISISDSAFALLAYTKNIPIDDPLILFLIEHGYHSEDSVKKFRKYRRHEIWTSSEGLIVNTNKEIAKHTVVSRVFSFNDTYFKHVVMSCNNRLLTPGLLDLFGYMANVLGFYVKKDWEEEQNLNNTYNSLFRDLMSGKAPERESVDERARIIGIRPDSEYAIMLLTGGKRDNASFPGRMAQDIAKISACIKPVYYNSHLALLLHSPNLKRAMPENDIWNKLNDYFKVSNVYSGCSDFFDDLFELPEAYRQAEMALRLNIDSHGNANLLFRDRSRESNIEHFNMQFAEIFFDNSDSAERLWKSSRYGKLLLKLHDYDLEKNTNNLEVLYSYLLHERKATETAAVLHMHRNSVLYRIGRIEEMFGLCLDYPQTRMNILVSFLLLKRFGFGESE